MQLVASNGGGRGVRTWPVSGTGSIICLWRPWSPAECGVRGSTPRSPYAELAGALLVFFALRLGAGAAGRLTAQFVDDVLDGFLDANEREPGLGGDHDVGHVVVADAARFDH